MAEAPVSLRDGQQTNQLRSTMVFLHGRASEPTHVLQRAGRAVGARLRRRAVELLQLGLRDLVIGAQHEPEDQTFERSVVRADLAGVVGDSGGERLTGHPGYDLVVIESVGHAQHLRADVLGVIVHAPRRQVALAPRFKITIKDGHGAL